MAGTCGEAGNRCRFGMEGELPRCGRPCGGELSRHAARGPRFRDRGGFPSHSDWQVTAIMKDIPGADTTTALPGTPPLAPQPPQPQPPGAFPDQRLADV